ncbi:MAG: extracellular solute-binding protein, partial [Anaerolineales bacterium]|nr:extracellular solute-binding protein [Anaerolineales bacterium]
MSPHRVTRRSFLRYAGMGGAALVATLAGCTREVEVTREVIKKETVVVDAPKPTPLPIELMHWSNREAGKDEASMAWTGKALEIFHDKYPDVKIILENHAHETELVPALMAGTEPDLMTAEVDIQSKIANNLLLPIDDIYEPIKDDVLPGTCDAATWDGHVYGLSEHTAFLAMLANNDVLKKAGVPAGTFPATWDEALEVYNKITAAGKGEYYGCGLIGPQGS